jgi:hypothetical protein
MNSRKWQVGMTLLCFLSIGYLSFVPFLWRAIKLKEWGLCGLSFAAAMLTLGWVTNPNDFFLVADMLFGMAFSWWVFRPLKKKKTLKKA